MIAFFAGFAIGCIVGFGGAVLLALWERNVQ